MTLREGQEIVGKNFINVAAANERPLGTPASGAAVLVLVLLLAALPRSSLPRVPTPIWDRNCGCNSVARRRVPANSPLTAVLTTEDTKCTEIQKTQL